MTQFSPIRFLKFVHIQFSKEKAPKSSIHFYNAEIYVDIVNTKHNLVLQTLGIGNLWWYNNDLQTKSRSRNISCFFKIFLCRWFWSKRFGKNLWIQWFSPSTFAIGNFTTCKNFGSTKNNVQNIWLQLLLWRKWPFEGWHWNTKHLQLPDKNPEPNSITNVQKHF